MYKNLNPDVLGITGRQSELIELALTHGFRSIDIDIERYLKQARTKGPEQAGRFLASAKLRIGAFELPIEWRGAEESYKQELQSLDGVAQLLASSGGCVAQATVMPASDALPYHENFELHRLRLAEIGEVLAKHDIRLGVGFLASPSLRADQPYQFVCDAEAITTLVKSVSSDNVGLHLDTWNWHFGGGTTDQLNTLEGRGIISISIADVPGDVDAATVSDEDRRLPLEEGAVKNAEFIKTAVDNGFNGPITLQTAADCFKSLTREAIVQQCATILDELVKSAIGPPPEPVLADEEVAG